MNQHAIKIILCCYLLLFTWQFSYAQEVHLYPVKIDGNYGYLNDKGEEVIKAKFYAAENFHQGLAAARLNGTYGYIDSTGKYAIQPEFDYGYSFQNGVAIVYKNGRSFYIDKNGKELFDCSGYKRLAPFTNGIALVQTASKKRGVVDKSGRLIIDTLYGSIVGWYTDVCIVSDLMYDSLGEYIGPSTYGIVDANGRDIIPLDTYEEITSDDGEYFVGRDTGLNVGNEYGRKVYKYDVFDKKGNVLFSLDERDGISANGSAVQCGLLPVSIRDVPNGAGQKPPHWDFLDLKGKLVFDGTGYMFLNKFYKNRIFALDSNEQICLLNTKGKRLNKIPFTDVLGESFYNNVAFVEQESKWGVIDTNAVFVTKNQFESVRYSRYDNERFIFSQEVDLGEKGIVERKGICDFKGNVLLDPVIQYCNAIDAFKNGLLSCKIDDRWCYVNRDGKIIRWQDSTETLHSSVLNIDYMNVGAYYVSHYPDDLGFALNKADTNLYPAVKLSIRVRTDATDTTASGYKGYVCYVVNNSSSSVSFRTSTGRLRMTMQALDINNEWKDIEYFESSFCGNAHHDEQLKAWDYWSFVVPVYEGVIKTKMRMKLVHLDNAFRSNEIEYHANTLVVYSNEFEGSVNPGQFWRREKAVLGQNDDLPLN